MKYKTDLIITIGDNDFALFSRTSSGYALRKFCESTGLTLAASTEFSTEQLDFLGAHPKFVADQVCVYTPMTVLELRSSPEHEWGVEFGCMAAMDGASKPSLNVFRWDNRNTLVRILSSGGSGTKIEGADKMLELLDAKIMWILRPKPWMEEE